METASLITSKNAMEALAVHLTVHLLPLLLPVDQFRLVNSFLSFESDIPNSFYIFVVVNMICNAICSRF